MEEKEGMSSSGGGVAVKGNEAQESFRVVTSGENPSQISGSIVAATATATATATEVTPISVAASTAEVKKKRGRPRKYGPDGSVSTALSPMPISASIPLSGDFSAWKPSRGRSVDSFKKKHKLDSENSVSTGERIAHSVGANFTPHVITVNTGEDVTMKIISFSQQGSRAICILAANGGISNVTLRQPNSSGGTLTYEGFFEILSLTGSFMPSDNGVTKSRSGGMSVSLAGPDGRILGGGLAGMLLAAGPVQVVLGSFVPGQQQEQQKQPKKQKIVHATTFAVLPAHSFSDERTEGGGGYRGQNPNLTSSASFHEDNIVPVSALHTKISVPAEIIHSAAATAECKDQNSSKCEVSC